MVASVDGLALVDHHGLPSIRIATAHSTAVVSLFGGQLLSFTPEGGTDALWLSPDTLPPPQPTRGGSPVIWPYFSRQGQTDALPAHGLVRTLPWTLLEASRDRQGNIELLLAPPALDGLPLQLRMRLHVGRSLRQQLITTNISASPVIFTEALHNYLRVGDVSRVQVEGVDGTVYRNKGEPYSMARAQHGTLALAAFADSGIDRIYRRTDGQYQLLDPSLQRRISLRTTGSNSLVTWNAGRGAETRSQDIGPGWRHYLCLETANVGQDVVTLAPGARHVMGQQISVEPL
ncbi:aldose epimerase [Pseudoxanthomonas dokdonensis]|uniref:glucose-6-phosphate 1-epimerase n=1 Tax=Pseudoxanthomonas dokdonensis TaxID=344882 RepID=A0A0R0CX80_9GAMM|nr:aldose epimerase [Pseudoxanthomonas dokdonensis]